MRTITLAAGAALILGLAGSAFAQSDRPDYKDLAQVEAWMARAKITGMARPGQEREWLLVGVAPEGVYLSRRLLDSSHNRGSKFTIVVNRLELFAPQIAGDRMVSSISYDNEVDCLHRTTRRVVETTYLKHNLVGSPKSTRLQRPFRPVSEDPAMVSVIDDICRAVEG